MHTRTARVPWRLRTVGPTRATTRANSWEFAGVLGFTPHVTQNTTHTGGTTIEHRTTRHQVRAESGPALPYRGRGQSCSRRPPRFVRCKERGVARSMASPSSRASRSICCGCRSCRRATTSAREAVITACRAPVTSTVVSHRVDHYGCRQPQRHGDSHHDPYSSKLPGPLLHPGSEVTAPRIELLRARRSLDALGSRPIALVRHLRRGG